MTAPEDRRERFRTLPEPVGPEDAVETVDAASGRPVDTDSDRRDRMLREAGGA